MSVRFDPSSPEVGPFPTDALTVPDATQKTGRRVNLPLPDCRTEVSACANLAILNQYDGFSLLPRIRVRFSGPVNVDTLREGVFLLALENLTHEEYGLGPVGKLIPINQVIYDPDAQTVYAKPDEVLDQHRRYALIVTNAVRDRAGDPVEASPGFLGCATQPSGSYCEQLASWIGPFVSLAERLGATRRVVAASVFTTLSATAWLERARDLLANVAPNFRRTGSKSVFDVSDLASILVRQQNQVNPPAFQEARPRIDLLDGVGRIAFGSYRSPNFLTSQQVVPAAPTGAALPLPAGTNEIFVQALLPASPKPASGYPVVIAGHGRGSNRFNFPLVGIGRSMAAQGYATISITAVGHGFGPEGRVIITEKNGAVTDLPAGGRGVDMNGDGMIESDEGCRALPSVVSPDCLQHTALDLMQLVRAIRAGMDLDGDGTPDLDPDRISFIGISLGAMYGTVLAAVEPSVQAAVLSADGGTAIDSYRWSPDFAPEVASMLASRTPPVAPNKGNGFDWNYVLRDQPVKVNDVPGAIDLQDILETLDWIWMPGDPLAYAPHLRVSTLPGVPIKRVLFQTARGDQSMPNPLFSALVRAANMREWSVLYRFDLARAIVPEMLANPHSFLTQAFLRATPPAEVAVALAAQQQAARFFSTGARCNLDEPCIPDVNDMLRPVFGRNVFETPQVLPEDLGFPAP